jgi:hypothetical protein
MEQKINNPARNRMEDRILFFIMPLLITLIVLCYWVFGYLHIQQPTSTLAYLFAALLALLFIGSIVIFGLYLTEEKDEFERTVITQSMLWGTGATLTVAAFWGALELMNKVHHLNPVWLFILFPYFMGIAKLLVKRRYR